MDYSQYQVKYIENPTFVQKIPEIDYDSINFDTPDISNISQLNAEAAPPTALIQETQEKPITEVKKKKSPIRKVISRKLPDLKPSRGLSAFNLYYDQAVSQDPTGQLAARRNLFTRLANQESSFRYDIGNSRGVPAFGYFQFMQGNYRGKYHNNVGQYAGVDLDTFRRNPIIQIQAANNLANYFMNSFSKTELQRLHQMGYSDSAIIAGAWLGGPGGVKAFAFGNQNRRDVNGTGVGDYMQMFNNL